MIQATFCPIKRERVGGSLVFLRFLVWFVQTLRKTHRESKGVREKREVK